MMPWTFDPKHDGQVNFGLAIITVTILAAILAIGFFANAHKKGRSRMGARRKRPEFAGYGPTMGSLIVVPIGQRRALIGDRLAAGVLQAIAVDGSVELGRLCVDVLQDLQRVGIKVFHRPSM